MAVRTVIKDFYGKILGYIDQDISGDKTVRNFYQQILGYYDKKKDVTLNFYRQIIAKGDTASSLLYNEPTSQFKR